MLGHVHSRRLDVGQYCGHEAVLRICFLRCVHFLNVWQYCICEATVCMIAWTYVFQESCFETLL